MAPSSPELAGKTLQQPEPKQLLDELNVPKPIQELYAAFEEAVLAIDENVWRKVTRKEFTFYSPKRVFVCAKPQKKTLRLHMFTRGEPLEGVRPLGLDRGGAKWGRMHVFSLEDLPKAVEAAKESHARVQIALANNEPTGWWAATEEESDSDDDVAEPDA